MSVAKLATRALIGGLFIGHGAQKLGTSFGGHGLDATAGMMASMDLHPGKRNAQAAGYTEAGGGALLALGLATPLASAAVIGTMVTAILKVHGSNGPWATNGGWEYNGVLIAASALLAETGPGAISLDHVLGIERTGAIWGIGALALGTAASYAVVEMGRRAKPADAPASPLGETTGDPATSN